MFIKSWFVAVVCRMLGLVWLLLFARHHTIYTYADGMGARRIVLRKQRNFISASQRGNVCYVFVPCTHECGVCDSMRLFVLRQLDMKAYGVEVRAVEIGTGGCCCVIHSTIFLRLFTVELLSLHFTPFELDLLFPLFLTRQTPKHLIDFHFVLFASACMCDTVSFSIYDYQSHVYYESIKNRKQTMSVAVASLLFFSSSSLLFILEKFENAHICSSYGKEASIKKLLGHWPESI